MGLGVAWLRCCTGHFQSSTSQLPRRRHRSGMIQLASNHNASLACAVFGQASAMLLSRTCDGHEIQRPRSRPARAAVFRSKEQPWPFQTSLTLRASKPQAEPGRAGVAWASYGPEPLHPGAPTGSQPIFCGVDVVEESKTQSSEQLKLWGTKAALPVCSCLGRGCCRQT